MTRPPLQPRGASALAPVLRRLGALQALSPALTEQIAALDRRTETVAAGVAIGDMSQKAPRPRFIVDGWACRFRLLSDGRRQLFSLLIPGDGIGLSGSAPVQTAALTQVTLVDATPLAGRPDPEFAALAARVAACEESLLLDQIVRLGRQTAYERAAHLLVELGARLERCGLGQGDAFRCPLTQEVFADMLGLSVVHVNRTLQQLRRDGLIRMVHGEMRLLDVDALKRLCDYQPPAG